MLRSPWDGPRQETTLIKSRYALPALALGAILQTAPAIAADQHIAGYVDRAENFFVRDTWNFLEHFQSPYTIGSHRWWYTQYYWNEEWFFGFNSRYFADAVHLIYATGHGYPYWLQTDQANNRGIWFDSAAGLGNAANNGRAKFLTIDSCSTVLSARDRTDWYSIWLRAANGTHIFQGLHQLTGYRTTSYGDNGITCRYARRLAAQLPVWQAWFSAVDGERAWWKGRNYPGFASAMVFPGLDNDTLGNYGPNPPYNHWELRNYYQY